MTAIGEMVFANVLRGGVWTAKSAKEAKGTKGRGFWIVGGIAGGVLIFEVQNGGEPGFLTKSQNMFYNDCGRKNVIICGLLVLANNKSGASATHPTGYTKFVVLRGATSMSSYRRGPTEAMLTLAVEYPSATAH